MAEPYTVRSEEDFEPIYTEDEMVLIRKGDLRAILDVCTGSMDFGSGFLDNEQTEALRAVAPILGIDPIKVTPSNFLRTYCPDHRVEITAREWEPHFMMEFSGGAAPDYWAFMPEEHGGVPMWYRSFSVRCHSCGMVASVMGTGYQVAPRTDDTPPEDVAIPELTVVEGD